MKNSTLVFRSLFVIILLAGSAQLVTYAAQEKPVITKDSTTITTEKTVTNWETDYIIGKWKVSYDSEEFKGTVVYTIKKEGKVFNAYTYKYQDAQGNSEPAENTKTLIIQSFDGYKGKGVYKVTYEGENYDIECFIDMIDENTFQLSYESYGFSDVETWKRAKL